MRILYQNNFVNTLSEFFYNFNLLFSEFGVTFVYRRKDVIAMSNIGNKETMSRNLSYYVERSGKSQKELAEIVGVAASTFNDWIKGKKYPRIDKIEIMANYFGILKSDLIEEKTKEHKEMQKNNDTLASIIVRLRTDSDFLAVVENLYELDKEKIQGVMQMLSAFSK